MNLKTSNQKHIPTMNLTLCSRNHVPPKFIGSEATLLGRWYETFVCVCSSAVHFVKSALQPDLMITKTPFIPVDIQPQSLEVTRRRGLARANAAAVCALYSLRQEMLLGVVNPGYRFYGRGRLKKLNR